MAKLDGEFPELDRTQSSIREHGDRADSKPTRSTTDRMRWKDALPTDTDVFISGVVREARGEICRKALAGL
jgi:hypothetical protein